MVSLHTIYSDKRKSGISLIGDLCWGTDFCQFYQTENDLLEVLLPYFRAGLENNELCVWMTSGSAQNARKALEKAFPRFGEYVDRGQIEIIPHRRWRAQSGSAPIVSKLDEALASGFDGLRIAWNAVPEKRGAKSFASDASDLIGRYNIIALFLYPRDKFDAVGLMEAVKSHRFALVKNAGRWELIESCEVRVAKDALKRSEEKLHSLFSNMLEGFAYHRIVLDGEGKPCDYVFLEINEAFEKLTGLKGREIIGKKVTEVLPGIEKDPADWIGKCGEVALAGEPVQFESYAELLKRWYSVSAFSPHKGYFATTFSDITERKLMEGALRESEEKLRVTLTSIGDAVIATDGEGRITFMNPVAAHLTGWEVDDARERMIDEVFRIVNERTREPAEDIVRRVLREGRVASLANHTALLTRNGREVPIEDSAAPIKDESGNVSGVVLIFHDVTEQRRAQQALRASEAQLRTILENVNQGVVVSHLDGNLFYWNPASLEMHGFSSMEECRRLLPELSDTFELSTLEGAVLPLDQWPLSRILRGEHLRNCEIRVRRTNSDWQRVFSYGGNLAFDSLGQALIAVVTVNDVTERKHMEEELRRARDELELRVRERTIELQVSNKALMDYAAKLERLNEELQDFAFVAAHDLQEPLRKIQTFCDLIEKRSLSSLDASGREYLDRVTSSASRMRNLLHDLLQFSRVACRPEEFKEIDLGKTALEAADIFEEDLRRSEGIVEIENLPHIEADRDQMFRLFQNLIGNALKYRSGESPEIKILSKLEGRRCEIFVTDNGIGFDQKFSERIFKPFQRLHDRREYEGTGMGLAICRKIVEWHGGRIRAESEPGKGSTFIIELPARQDRKEGME